MKSPIRLASLLTALSLLSLNVHAELSYTGQLQQELISWTSPLPLASGFQIRDGGERQLASHDVEGASYLALLSTFHLTPNYQGLARFQFDLAQETGLEQYEAYVGLKGQSSSWRMGTISSPYKSVTADWDPFLATFMQARGNGGASLQNNGYVKSSIVYQAEWWASDVALLWSPENGNSLSLAHHLTKWDFALAINSDQSGTTQNRATKLGVRYHSNEWMSAFQYESLKNGTTPASNAYINLFKQDGKSEYGGSLGVYRSDSATELDLNYIALGMKYAIAKNNIIHAGYRVSSAPSDGSQSEKAFGLGFRYSF